MKVLDPDAPGEMGACYRHWRVHAYDVALLDQKLPRLVAQLSHLRFWDRPTCAELCDGPTKHIVSVLPESHGVQGALVKVAHDWSVR